MIKAKGEKIFDICNTVFLVLLCVAMLYPLLYVLGRSFMTESYLANHPLSIIPMEADLYGYQFIFKPDSYIMKNYIVTIARTVIGTGFCLFFTALMAYALSKKYFPARKTITFMVVFTMWFGGGIIPYYLLILDMHLMNNFQVYIWPMLISAWNLILMRNFFSSIPDELEESAKMDGANDAMILFSVYVPLSKGTFATLGLFYAVDHWNSWFDALLFMNNKNMWTLQLMLREILQSASSAIVSDPSALIGNAPPSEIVKFASIVIATVPILCVYPFLQRYFVKGVMVGSLKG
jgi:putative aldouronate transport system permease protein